MKKIINDPSHVVEEMIAGLVSAYPTYLKNYQILRRSSVPITIQCTEKLV